MTTSETAYAHSRPDRPHSEWQPLADHLDLVAEAARMFADAFGSAEWGRLAGLWHDLGKYAPEFQKMIGAGDPDAHVEGASGRVDHSSAGAMLAWSKDSRAGKILAFGIAGHHAGLADDVDLFRTRLVDPKRRESFEKLRHLVPARMLDAPLPVPPAWLQDGPCGPRTFELWIRFLFSALCDADFLDTERFYDSARTSVRGTGPALSALKESLDSHLQVMTRDAPRSTVNEFRARVLATCRARATDTPGIFSLTVPTGGGKTLASLAFALDHAMRHDLRRVVIAIPFTSIIEQTAAVYRGILPEGSIVEHHSSLDPAREDHRNRLACENWDAPVIVTTNVQLLESLFAARPSRCRKLHNLARSVIAFDEAQTLPVALLAATLEVLQELRDHYGCTIVLSTATQPALGARVGFPGLRGVREIMDSPAADLKSMQRVDVAWPPDPSTVTTYEQLAGRMAALPQALAIVHRRDDARALVRLLPPDTLHLSALMCPAHRSAVLRDVKDRQKRGAPCRLVATQVVEAGVDIDFPVVFRAMAGLDALAQAAGRCNREGRSARGRFEVFVAETSPPQGLLRKGFETALGMLREAKGAIDLFDPAVYERYFRKLHNASEIDAHGIQALRKEFNYRQVAERFQVIEETGTEAVVVPYSDEAAARVERLRCDGPSRLALRRLQPFLVKIYPKQVRALGEAGAVERVAEQALVIAPAYRGLYDERFGLVLDGPLAADPEALMA